MMITALWEKNGETRVAITPTSAKHYIKSGFAVAIEKNAGLAAGFSNEEYESIGVQICQNKKELLAKTNILLCINEPDPKALAELPEHTFIVGHIDNIPNSKLMTWCVKHKISLFSMNHIPRISRAQNIDSLSSQANLAGYRAVLEAIQHFNRAIPMMMTAAGMIQPAKVLILGAGVAGLQAIATAKRIGAVVYAFDVRKAAKEQVESLGAEFIEVIQEQNSESQSGYATETSEEYKKLQTELIDHYAKMVDIIISTALIPDKKAPLLLYKKTVKEMKPGSVIVDLATARGGNCEVSIQNEIIKYGEITVIGSSNMAGLVPATASDLYANNLVHLINLLTNHTVEIKFNPEDEIVQRALLCHQGTYLPFAVNKESQNA